MQIHINMLCYTLPQYDVMLLPVMMLLNMYLAGFVRYGIMAMAYTGTGMVLVW